MTLEQIDAQLEVVRKERPAQPEWWPDWTEYPHSVLSVAHARELSLYAVRLEDINRTSRDPETGYEACLLELKRLKTPVKPTKPNPDWNLRMPVRSCGACSSGVNERHKFCPNCGVPLNWKEKA